jgi:thiol-disulfide isomerase/thioredoxin
MNQFSLKSFDFRHNDKFRLPPIFLIFIGLLACTSKSTEQSASEREETSILEKIKLKDLNERPIDLNQYQGKAIFINFWATWCGPCIKEMPSIERVKNLLKGKRIEFLVASNESIEQIQSFVKKQNLDLRYVQLQNMEELNILALPTTLIISPDGELLFSEVGYREWDTTSNIKLLTKIINDIE